MKLVHAHIENFGKLQDYDLDFTDGLNKVVYDNGWGKSTLVAFIRVMLYGFENERKRSELENERKRFEPWQGGTYGGALVFEQDGKQYRIERVFEKGNDSFELFDSETNLPTNDFSENVGEELFGIDRESFSRTVFVGQQDCATEVTSQINSKIGNISTDTADMAMYDRATSALHDEQNRISARRSTGELAKLRDTIAKKEAFVSSKAGLEVKYENASRNIAECQDQIEDQERIIRACDKQLEEAALKNRLLADKKEFAAKVEEKNRAEQELKEVREKFPKGAPTLEEIDEIINIAGNADGLTQVVEETALPKDDQKEYLNYQFLFQKGVPSDEKLEEIKQTIEQIEDLRAEKQIGVLSDEELLRYSELETKFSLGVPREETIDRLLREWNTKTQLENRLDGLHEQYDRLANRLRATAASNKMAAEQRAKAQYDADLKLALMILAAGVAIFLLGIVLYFKFKAAWLLIIALLGLGTIAYGYFWKKPNESMIQDVDYEGKDFEKDPELVDTADQIRETEGKIQDLEEGKKAFLTEYGFTKNNVDDMDWFMALRDDVRAYNGLVERAHSQSGFQETLSELTIPLKEFFKKYKIDSNLGSFSNDLFRLKNMIARYQFFKKTVKRQRETRGQLERDTLTVESFLKQYAFDAVGEEVDLTSVRDDVIALENAKNSFEERKTAVDVFKSEHDLSAIQLLDDYEEADLASIRDTKEAANESRGRLEASLKEFMSSEEDLATSLQQIEDAEEELEALREREKELAWRQTIVNKTAEYLKEAKNNFLKKYLAPMQNAFDRYYELLSGEDEDVYELDANLNITKRANGKRRNIGLLSEGYKDLVGLCRRMAMVDAMYEDEKPFLIFDDPFVNLDDEKLECGLEFMKNISQKYQVIYTTCHTSRSV